MSPLISESNLNFALERRFSSRRESRNTLRCRCTAQLTDWWQAEVRDVSVEGIGMICRRFDPGNLLVVEAIDPDGLSTSINLAKVVRAMPALGRYWLVACQWVRPVPFQEF